MKIVFLLSRIGSYAIDYLLYYLMLYALSKYGVIGYLSALMMFFLYRFISTAKFGATLGMKLLKLKLAEFNYKVCFYREIYRFGSALFWIGYIIGLFDPFNRTLHDLMSGTYVVYNEKVPQNRTPNTILKLVFNVLLIVSILRWSTNFILNDIGMFGLKRAYVSDMYYQSFEGDNLASISQDELYMKSLGRKYTTVIETSEGPALIKISNRGTYIDVYRLKLKAGKISGEHLYKFNIPLQYICSGNFRGKLELCGLSPGNDLVVLDEEGSNLKKSKVNVKGVIKLMCGDIDLDNRDEAVILGRDGEVEVYKIKNNGLLRIYKGKFGEDIVPKTFYISEGIKVLGKGEKGTSIYEYVFSDNEFILKSKQYIAEKEVSYATEFLNGIIISHVNRNNMLLRVGRTQIIKLYAKQDSFKKLYNFGSRPAKGYDFMVRTLEGVYDIDGDNIKELIIKAVRKNDVMGEGYIVEIYKPNERLLVFNRILTKINDILT